MRESDRAARRSDHALAARRPQVTARPRTWASRQKILGALTVVMIRVLLQRPVVKVPGLRIEIVKRAGDVKGFVLPRRRVVEGAFSWFGRNRRLRESCGSRPGRRRHCHGSRRYARFAGQAGQFRRRKLCILRWRAVLCAASAFKPRSCTRSRAPACRRG